MPERKLKTVLVVDDDKDILTLASIVLGDEGYEVQTAVDGREALESLKDHLPDLILLDMKMPVMDGWEFARNFRVEHGSATPIVVFTASVDAKKESQEIGAVGWLGKPFDLDRLVAVVDRHIRKE